MLAWFHNAGMRYRDASHVDVGSFYSRAPFPGKIVRLLGHGAIAAFAIAAWRHDTCLVTGLLIALLLVWLAAWWLVVGTLWRASVVAGVVACGVYLAAERWSDCCAACDARHSPPLSAPRAQP